ncbi:myotubularin-related protein 4 isoform X1 [Erpetoichthys calabaricus]|uniref:phosphatidylinositol-3,5-bisphosphate 3-phosphatase n=1 Tax=Erpetoichthys calabaricus TaxID=27687 RepID=A0A8C4T218_ERPCA|nr:myotubularin-related protein 4 isoform X1 [Erpetoichthys calabaricus]
MRLAGGVSCSMLNCFGEEGPPSLEYIQAKDLFPHKELVKEDESLQVPFPVLQGEGVEYLGRTDDAIIAISNYRLHIKYKDSIINVPLRLIENVESRDMFQLHIICKDSKLIRCHFPTFKQCQEWLKKLNRATLYPARIEDLFAFAYHAWCLGVCADDEDQHVHLCRPGDHVRHRFEMELIRMGFDLQNAWRVSDINNNYKLCWSYPQKLLVPVWITDKELESISSFRSWKRIPVVVYRHQQNGAVIARCSQPEISWWGWRNTDDEYLVTSIAKACALNPGSKSRFTSSSRARCEGSDPSESDFDSSLTAGPTSESAGTPQKLLILDARSYTAAVANRAKGGGCECEEYYPNCEVMFMGMANIHSIRNSFQSLRAVCSQIPDPGNWLSALESTKWLQHLSVMLKAAVLVSNAIEREGRPVLVHCSDGWDRTPQIVALAKILLDPFYRTIEGFQVLVETEWLDFGHKFGDRCGHQENSDDLSEQCPVFLQWLDCIHQLLKQFPCLFEFNEAFLVKLVQHTYSCLYGTFLCNNAREREARNTYNRTCSVWSLLRPGNKNFQNFLYIPGHDVVLQPVCHVRALHLWTAVYLPTSSPCTAAEENIDAYLSPEEQSEDLTSRSLDRLPKTRSMDNLVTASENGTTLARTSSDPNLNKHCQEEEHAILEQKAEPLETTKDIPEGTTLLNEEYSSIKHKERLTLPSGDCQKVDGNQEEVSDENFNSLKGCCSNVPFLSNPDCVVHSDVSSFTNANSEQAEDTVEETETFDKSSLCQVLPEDKEQSNWTSENTKPCSLHTCVQVSKSRHETDCKENVFAPTAVELLRIKAASVELEDSTETLTEHRILEETCHKRPLLLKSNGLSSNADYNCIEVSRLGRAHSDTAKAVRKFISQSQFSEFSVLGSNWESMQGLVKSAYNGESLMRRGFPPGYQNRRLTSKLLRAQGLASLSGQSCQKEILRQMNQTHTSWFSGGSAMKNVGYMTLSNSRQLPPPLPPGKQILTGMLSPCLSYLDDDGLSVPVDAVQQRLRQIEASYKQEVELLRGQVRELQMRLESKQCCMPPAEPDVDYEDDFTCLRESDDSDVEDSLSVHSDDRLSEASWEPVEQKDTEVTRWVPDHMASHCFSCDSEFWLAKRRHHCRNCGNVFCGSCCHLKQPIPEQQLYDPVLVCNSCFDQIQVSKAREIMSQQLKKAITTASS